MSAKGFCVCLLLTLFLLPVPASGDGNVLLNPGFEDGTINPWSARNCSIAVVGDPNYVYSGSYSGLAYGRTASWQGIKQSMLDRMIPGNTYKISGHVRLEKGAAPNSVGITVEQSDADGTRYIPVKWAPTYEDSWTHLSGNFEFDVNGVLTTLDVYFECLHPTVSFYVDDANVYGPEPLPPPPPDPNATGLIDISIRHQNIEGFGASVAWYESFLTWHPLKDELYDILFGELGLDIYRLRNCYDQDFYKYYMSASSEIITEGELSLGRPLKIMMSSWSPPAYLKSNDSTVVGTLKIDPCDNEFMYEEFAEWWYDSLVEWSNYGVDANYVNIQNEPDYVTPRWDTCLFTPIEYHPDAAGYNLAFEAVWDLLDDRMGPNMPKMLAADATGLNNCPFYLNELIDPCHVYGYSHHLYNINSGDNPDAYIPAMENFALSYGDRPLMQTEYSQDDHTTTLDAAIDLAVLMHNSLTVEEVSAYLYWELFWGYDPCDPNTYKGLVTLDFPWADPCAPPPGYTINPIYYAFKHYSAFVHSGWQRVGADCNNPHLRMSAYTSPDSQELSVVLINTTSNTDIKLDLSFGDLTILDGEVYRTSATENCELLDGPGGGFIPTGITGKGLIPASFEPEDPLILPAMTITTLSLSTTGIPLEARLFCAPKVLKTCKRFGSLKVLIKMPEGITPSDVNDNEPLLFLPGGIESTHQYVYSWPIRKCNHNPERTTTYVMAFFDKSDCIDNLSNGSNEVIIVGMLTSGQYYEAKGRLQLIPCRPYPWRWPCCGHRYNFGWCNH